MAIERASIAATEQEYINFLYALEFVVGILPLLCLYGLLLYWLFSRCGCCSWLRRLRWWHRGYVVMRGDGEDADAYCDREVNPQAYPVAHVPANRLINYPAPSQ